MDKIWYIQENDRCTGPMALDEVYELISASRVGPTAWLGRDEEDVWMPLDAFKQSWPDPRGNGQPVSSAQPGRASERIGVGTGVSAGGEPSKSTRSGVVVDPGAFATASPQPSFTTHEATPPVIERDSILILGRRRSGKTTYLATLYSMLWKTVSGLTMKALSGPTHKMLMMVSDQLRRGEWPEATLGARQLEFELNDHGKKRLLVAFDYSGEDFRRAFVDEDTDSPEVKALLKYVDRAAAVILLIDPSVATEGKVDEAIDDDFGMVQAVQRIRNWHGGRSVPVVLALTKADRNRELMKSKGSAAQFVLHHYPALARTMGRLPIFKVQAVQETRNDEGRIIPNPSSVSVNVDKPLLYCLNALRQHEAQSKRSEARTAARLARKQSEEAEVKAIADYNRRFIIKMIALVVSVATGAVALWLIRKHLPIH